MSVMVDLRNPAQHGTPTSFCIGRRHDWLLVGTSHGVLDLWDLRFRLRLRSWAFPNAAPITRLQLHPSRKTARRNRVCVSSGTARGEVTVWDIEKVICHEIYRPAHPNSKERLHARDYELRNLDDESKAAAEGLLSRVADGPAAAETKGSDFIFNSTSTPASTVYAVFGLNMQSEDSETQPAFAVTGGPDNKVRFWDCERLEGCRIVNGAVDEKPTYTMSNLSLDTKVISEKPPESTQQAANAVESNKVAGASPKRGGVAGAGGASSSSAKYEAIRLSARSLLQGHLDMVTDVAVLERPFGMIVSGDRSGRVFVYQ
jgi:phosphoinositide-3-kinase regulatory subunit 4